MSRVKLWEHLFLNKLKGVFNTVAIKAPGFGDTRTAMLEDIAILTGATLISVDQGTSLETATLDMLGSARRVLAGKDETTIIEGAGQVAEVKNRVHQIKNQAENASSEYDKRKLSKNELPPLHGKVAVIKVGGATETEIEEKKFRVDDAVAAVKAALNEGVVPGGGVTLVDALSSATSGGDNLGGQILHKALEQPFRILLENANLNADQWLPKIRESKEQGLGIDGASPIRAS